MPEVDQAEVEEMTDDEIERAAEEAIDTTGEDQEVMGFAPRDS